MKKIIDEIKLYQNEEYATHHHKFFQAAKGGYGEGDLFYGLRVPEIRIVAKKYYKSVSIEKIEKLLQDSYHEVRLIALFMMVFRYEKADFEEKTLLFNLYLKNVNYINNWDLVDLSAPKIIGAYIYETQKYEPIYALANSDHLWSNRIAVVATHYFIKRGDFKLINEFSEKFLTHKHDLMHKAVGWMLREMGKIDIKPLYAFLDRHNKKMPRTMLRYSIEKLSPTERKFYMEK